MPCEAGFASLAFSYCDFREDQKDIRGLLSDLLVQLCHQIDSYFKMPLKLYTEHADGPRDPSNDALAASLRDLLRLQDVLLST